MIAEGLDKLLELLERGGKPVACTEVGLHDRKFVLGGLLHDIPPPSYVREVGSVQDLIAATARALEWHAQDTSCDRTAPEIWVWETGVTMLLKANDTRERVYFTLSYSRAWKILKGWAESPDMLEQRKFVRELLLTFECDEAIVAPWRRLDFSRSVMVQGEVAHGRDRLGKEIQSQASGLDKLPETITVCVPIFEQSGERDTYSVTCKVELDAAACRIGLVPRKSELASIEESHLEAIIARIKEELPDTPVYFGRVR